MLPCQPSTTTTHSPLLAFPSPPTAAAAPPQHPSSFSKAPLAICSSSSSSNGLRRTTLDSAAVRTFGTVEDAAGRRAVGGGTGEYCKMPSQYLFHIRERRHTPKSDSTKLRSSSSLSSTGSSQIRVNHLCSDIRTSRSSNPSSVFRELPLTEGGHTFLIRHRRCRRQR